MKTRHDPPPAPAPKRAGPPVYPVGGVSETMREWLEQGSPRLHVRVSLDPPHAVNGRPVVLERVGGHEVPLDDVTGLEKAMIALWWTRAALAEACGKSKRAIDNYLGKRPRYRVPAEVLLVLRKALERPR